MSLSKVRNRSQRVRIHTAVAVRKHTKYHFLHSNIKARKTDDGALFYAAGRARDDLFVIMSIRLQQSRPRVTNKSHLNETPTIRAYWLPVCQLPNARWKHLVLPDFCSLGFCFVSFMKKKCIVGAQKYVLNGLLKSDLCHGGGQPRWSSSTAVTIAARHLF